MNSVNSSASPITLGEFVGPEVGRQVTSAGDSDRDLARLEHDYRFRPLH